jgi:alpha-mannosidase
VGKSTIEQRIYLSAHSKSLQFRTTVDWCEARRMLRVAFPLESAAQTASCDIQFGYVSRPTHANTEWDFAKFEVCAHRYVDISDGDYGVALLNDCKYGHSVRDNVIDLALLRSPLYPDPDADLGIHEFTYVLAPHSGDLVHSDVMAQAAALNRPPLLFPGVRTETRRVPITVEGEGASIEALKKAEKEDALVVRVVETRGARSKVSLLCDGGIGRLVETDLMEWKNLGEVPCAGGKAELELAPFEIKTFKAYRS